jgi:hypothetical protein
MERKAIRQTTLYGEKGKKTDNFVRRERQEDRQLCMERKARRQTTQDKQEDKKTGNSGLTERPRRMTTLYGEKGKKKHNFVWRERQEDRPFRIDKHFKLQACHNDNFYLS